MGDTPPDFRLKKSCRTKPRTISSRQCALQFLHLGRFLQEPDMPECLFLVAALSAPAQSICTSKDSRNLVRLCKRATGISKHRLNIYTAAKLHSTRSPSQEPRI